MHWAPLLCKACAFLIKKINFVCSYKYVYAYTKTLLGLFLMMGLCVWFSKLMHYTGVSIIPNVLIPTFLGTDPWAHF